MTKVSKYFTLEELECKCSLCKSGKNKMPTKVYTNLLLLAKELDRLREKIGKPMIVDSGYRCVAHNAKIGGVRNSAHTMGYACDWHVNGMTEEDMFKIASGIDYKDAGKLAPKSNFKGVGYYKGRNFCHVDIMPTKPRPNTWVG